MSAPGFPSARLDRIARLHALAAGLPGCVVLETVLDAPFDRAWAWVSDLERSVPAFDSDVADLRVLRRRPLPDPVDGDGDGDSERLLIRSRSSARALWLTAVFDVDLAPGWCWMTTRPQVYIVGMAAEPDGDRTRFAQLEGVGIDAPGPVRLLVRPLLALSRWRHRRHVPHDLAAIARLVGEVGEAGEPGDGDGG